MRLSSSKQTQILFVTGKILKGEVKVAYCPMENMLTDLFTKPLQGLALRMMWDIILNLPSKKLMKCTGVCLQRVKNDGIEMDEKMTGT